MFFELLNIADGHEGVGLTEAVADRAEEVEGGGIGSEGGVGLSFELLNIADGPEGVGPQCRVRDFPGQGRPQPVKPFFIIAEKID